MATVNVICEEIIKKVTDSTLDYQMKQTPYSLFFSIRKKFSNKSLGTVPEENLVQNLPQVQLLGQELLNMRNEYKKLYEYYQQEMDTRVRLEIDLAVMKETANKADSKAIKLGRDKKEMLDKYETKSLEIKQLKGEIDSLRKDKNSLSVALKASQKSLKEQAKDFDKKKEMSEKTIKQLTDFKANKLAEERQQKLKNRKEMKKAKRLEEANSTKTSYREIKISETSMEKEAVEEAGNEEIFVDKNFNPIQSEASSGDLERVCDGEVKKETSEDTDETNVAVFKVKGEDEPEVSDVEVEGLISKEDFLEFMAQHREDRKTDRAKFFEDLRTDLWNNK